jgi:hypothetical protein
MAALLQTRLQSAIQHESKDAGGMGLDGEIYLFSTRGNCGMTWSPDANTPASALVNVFYTLNIQTLIPTRPLQLFWERKAYTQLLSLSGTPMLPTDYWQIAGFFTLVIATAALPLLVATLSLLFRNRPQRKPLFVLCAGAASYGGTCLVGLLLLPFVLVGSTLSDILRDDGYPSIANLVRVITDLAPWIIGISWLACSLTLPVFLRVKVWPRLTTATSPR